MELITLTSFLDRLDDADIHYALSSVREGAILVTVSTQEERWEVEFMADGEIEIEIFSSDGEIHDESVLEELFARDDEE